MKMMNYFLTSIHQSERFLSIRNQQNKLYALYLLILIPSFTRSFQISTRISTNLLYNPKSALRNNSYNSFFDVNRYRKPSLPSSYQLFRKASYSGDSVRTKATSLMAFTYCSDRSYYTRSQLCSSVHGNSFSGSPFTPLSISSTHTRMRHMAFREDTEMDDESGDEFAEKVKLIRAWIQKNGKKEKDEEEKIQKQQWLSWLKQGILPPRGSDEIKMREAEELGGIPRGDRYASKDWWHNAVNLPQSAILRDISSPVFAISSWGLFISLVHRYLLKHKTHLAQYLSIPPTMHSLMVSALGLLLVFRTNSAYQRFVEGRQIWEKIQSTSRDLCRLAKLYEKEIGIEKRRRVQRLLAAFPYLLRHRIRPNLVMRKLDDPTYPRDAENSLLLYADLASLDNDVEAAAIATSEEESGTSRRKTRELYWVDKRTLPWRLLPKGAMEGCARAQNRPLWICDRMSKELATVKDGPNFTNRERLTLIGHVDKLSQCIGACERIHQTVVPLNYARHSLRTLTLWLASLPFAIVAQLGLLTAPTLFVMSWMLFGVYEIGYSIEDPFQNTLRLSILCDQIRRDILDNEIIMGSAYQLPGDPDIEEDEESENREDDETILYENTPINTKKSDSNGIEEPEKHDEQLLEVNEINQANANHNLENKSKGIELNQTISGSYE